MLFNVVQSFRFQVTRYQLPVQGGSSVLVVTVGEKRYNCQLPMLPRAPYFVGSREGNCGGHSYHSYLHSYLGVAIYWAIRR